jgi:sec-independent protein translocase protein TatA
MSGRVPRRRPAVGALSIWHIALVLVALALVFGTGKLKNAGKEIAAGLKEFKSAFKDEPQKKKDEAGSAS